MTPLRKRMIDAMQVRGMSTRTQDAYVGQVAALASYYHCSPAALDEAQVNEYLLHLARDRHMARSSVRQATCAIRFLYRAVLARPALIQVPLAKADQRLPEILARAELVRLFNCAGEGKPRAVLMTAYGLGLRVSELCHLRPTDIDSHPDRMCVRIVLGKGGKDRYVPLPPDVLEVLRNWLKLTHSREWVFCAQHDVTKPLFEDTAWRWYHAARVRAGITKRGGIHALRHCYATHMLESGVDLPTLSAWLGHNHVSTTMRYLHLARPDCPDGMRRGPLGLLTALGVRQ